MVSTYTTFWDRQHVRINLRLNHLTRLTLSWMVMLTLPLVRWDSSVPWGHLTGRHIIFVLPIQTFFNCRLAVCFEKQTRPLLICQRCYFVLRIPRVTRCIRCRMSLTWLHHLAQMMRCAEFASGCVDVWVTGVWAAWLGLFCEWDVIWGCKYVWQWWR